LLETLHISSLALVRPWLSSGLGIKIINCLFLIIVMVMKKEKKNFSKIYLFLIIIN
jgi:hypothetical protein